MWRYDTAMGLRSMNNIIEHGKVRIQLVCKMWSKIILSSCSKFWRPLEFRIASTSVRMVTSSWNLRGWGATSFLSSVFMDWTPASQSPPKCGVRGGMRCQVIDACEQKWESWDREIAISRWSCCISCLAPKKLLPLSEWMWAGVPRLAQNRRRAAKNSSVLRSTQSSKWIALVEKQTNKQA